MHSLAACLLRIAIYGAISASAATPRSKSGVAGAGARLAASALKLRKFQGNVGDVRVITFNENGSTVLTGHWNNSAKLWDQATGRLLHELTGHAGAVLSVAFCAGGAQALTGSMDSSIALWDVVSGFRLQTFALDSGWASSVACASAVGSSSAALVLGGSHEGVATLWDTSDGTRIGKYGADAAGRTDGTGVTTVALNTDGTTVLTAARDNSATLWDVASGRRIGRPLVGHKGWLLTACFSRDSSTVLTGSHDGSAKLWDAMTGKLLRSYGGDLNHVNDVALSEDAQLALTGSGDSVTRVWDVATGEPLRRFTLGGQVVGVGLARDAQSSKSRVMAGFLRRHVYEPDRSDRDQCEADCAAQGTPVHKEDRQQMPIFEL